MVDDDLLAADVGMVGVLGRRQGHDGVAVRVSQATGAKARAVVGHFAGAAAGGHDGGGGVHGQSCREAGRAEGGHDDVGEGRHGNDGDGEDTLVQVSCT